MNKKKKIMIIGLDGATFDIIDPLVNEGKLPNIAKIIKNGAKGNLTSTIPPITPAAWISLFTGKNPGAHGVFNFRTFDLSKYSGFNEEFVTSSWYAGQSIFDIFSENGYRVASIGAPMTYPPFKVNGVMVSSGAPRMMIDESSVYPKEIINEIGKLEVPVKFGRRNRDYFKEYMTSNLQKHLSIANLLLEKENYDLFMIVFGNTDWVAHQFWECCDNSFATYDKKIAEKHGKEIENQYILVDKALGELLRYVDDDTLLFIISDHGNGAHPINCVNLNYWLKQKGLLHTNKDIKGLYSNHVNNAIKALRNYVSRYKNVHQFLKKYVNQSVKEKISTLRLNINHIKWDATKAYAIPIMPMFDGIVINLKNKQPQGIVVPGNDYESLRHQLTDQLIDLEDPQTNRPVIKQIYRKEDIYHGKYLNNAPDLIVQYNEDYTGGTRIDGRLFSKIENYILDNNSSSHRLEGILIVSGGHIKSDYKIRDAGIVDILPTILYIMGLPVFDDIDGKILTEIFEEGYVKKNPTDNFISRGAVSSANVALNKEVAAEIKKVLQGLGYL